MNGIARAIALSSLVITFLAWGALAVGAPGGSDVADHPMIGDAAPGFELQGVKGKTYSLAGLKGKFVVIHFGASW